MENWQIKSHNFFDRTSLNFIKKWWLDIDKINFLLVISIIAFGAIVTATSSPAIANRLGVEKFFFLKKQLIFAGLGLILLISISFLDQEKIKVFAFFGLVTAIFLLVALLIFGSEAKGAKRWISLFGFTIQPSEFAKVFFIIFNAFLLNRLSKEKWQIKYGASTFLFLIIVALFLLQPDLGMTLTLSAIWAVQLFVFGLPMPFIIVIGVLAVCAIFGAYGFFPHFADRINRFLNDNEANYQVERSLDAFVNGSLFGTDIGDGVVKNYIPDAHTDFVFAVIAEEFGIVFCVFFLMVLFYLITRIVKRTLEEEDNFVFLTLCGLIMQFSLQTIVNIGVSLKMLPTKGMTLPFVSYGGSSMISSSICLGVILAFSKKKYHKKGNYNNFILG